jgi:hypothetical protein
MGPEVSLQCSREPAPVTRSTETKHISPRGINPKSAVQLLFIIFPELPVYFQNSICIDCYPYGLYGGPDSVSDCMEPNFGWMVNNELEGISKEMVVN